MLKKMTTETLKEFFAANDIKVYGWCSVDDEHKSKILIHGETLKKINSAIVFGIPLNKLIFENLSDGPDLLYLHHYRQANYILDKVAFHISMLLEENGFLSIPVPASQIVDWKNQKAHLSHKYFAYLCGLGWHGRNNLIVNSVYGSRLRFATILTSFQVKRKPQPVEFNCGNCMTCIEMCPAGAIKEKVEDFDHIACFNKIKEITKKNNISQYICGLCIKACDHGQTKNT